MTKDFFISYNSADRQWAEWIAYVLEEHGYSVIIQAWDFRPGGNFILDMQKATAEAKRTVMVLSDAYLQALYTQPEWAAAFQQDPMGSDRKLLPIRVAPCQPKGMLAAVVYIDFVGKTAEEAEQLLLAALEERAKPTNRPTFPDSTAPSNQTTAPASTTVPKQLSPSERLNLIQTLNALPGPQFDELLFALNPPSANVPGNAAPQGNRSAALLEWIESPIGPGLPELKAILESIVSKQSSIATQATAPSQTVETLKDIIKALATNQAPKYDLRGAQFGGGFAETVQGDQLGGNLASD